MGGRREEEREGGINRRRGVERDRGGKRRLLKSGSEDRSHGGAAARGLVEVTKQKGGRWRAKEGGREGGSWE